MSCLGPEYNPLPPREWVRFSNRCSQRNEVPITAVESYLLQMNRKANILQYKNTETTIFTKAQKLAYQATNKGAYSQARIQQLIALRATNEDEGPIIATLATNSGIKGDYKTLLFNNINVPVFNTI